MDVKVHRPDTDEQVQEVGDAMSENNIRIMCPNLTCRKVLIVPSSSRGKTVRCRNCATTIRVPQKNANASSASSAAPQAPAASAPPAGGNSAAA